MTTAGIWVSTTGSLELEALGMEGHGQKMAIRSPGYVWMHSGDSGILLTPEGIQVKSAELELKSPRNLRRGQYDDDLIQQLRDALDVVGFVWDGADVINMVISLYRGEPKEALTYLVCAIPVFGSFLRKGGKWLKSAGMDLVTKYE